MQETQVRSLGWEDLLEKEMATHSSIPAWRIPGTEEPGRLQSMGSRRVRHDWARKTETHRGDTVPKMARWAAPRIRAALPCVFFRPIFLSVMWRRPPNPSAQETGTERPGTSQQEGKIQDFRWLLLWVCWKSALLSHPEWPLLMCLYSVCSFWHCRMVCGILAPQPGIETAAPALEVQSLSHWTTQGSPC